MYSKDVETAVRLELERNPELRAMVDAYHELTEPEKAAFRLAAGISQDTAGTLGFSQTLRGTMDKQSAMEMVNEHWGCRLLDRGNTSFANINASKPVWWININPGKFKSDQHILLAKEGDGGLIWLRIESNSFPDLGKVFRVRRDKDCIDLEISSRPPKYMIDVKSGGTEYDFTKHIEHEWGPRTTEP